MSDCSYCEPWLNATICGDEVQTSYVTFVCTRPPGHDGHHVACGAHHQIARWHYDVVLEDSVPTGRNSHADD